jgi:AcrR family transcriptional regulator
MELVRKVRERRKAERPHAILDAAFEEFTRHGYAAARLDEVARRVGVTKGTIYFYFADKETLFVALISDLTKTLFSHVEAFATREDENGTTIDFLRAHLQLLYQTLVFDRKGRETFLLMIAEARRFPDLGEQYYKQVISPADKNLRVILLRGVARGELRPSAAALDYPEILFGPAMALNFSMHLFPKSNPINQQAYFDAHIDLILHGLMKHTPSADL